jgi:hypothetical protein
MILDLQPVHKTNEFDKVADDLTIFIPGSLVVNGVVELGNILDWVKLNKLTTDMSKSKEIVLRKSRS